MASEDTTAGQRWMSALADAQGAVDAAERRRDELVRQAQSDGVSVRAIANALHVDKTTVSRRYPRPLVVTERYTDHLDPVDP